MSDFPPPPPPPPPAGGPPPPQPGGYGAQPPAAGGQRPGELLDRFLARLIDGIIYGIVFFIIGIIFAAILVSDPSVNLSTGEVDGGSRVVYNFVSSIISTALVLGYFGFLESTRGQTIGKMAMKLKVVAPGGGNPTFQQAIKRNIWLALGLLGILGTFGSLLAFLLEIGAIIVIIIGINALPKRQTKFDEFGGDLQVVKIG